MSATTDFISELVRAANQVEKLGDSEKRRLLERAVTTIRDIRESVGIPATRTARDAVIDLQTAAAAIRQRKRTDTEIASALLNAAGMIRDLHMVLDTKTEIQIGVGAPPRDRTIFIRR